LANFFTSNYAPRHRFNAVFVENSEPLLARNVPVGACCRTGDDALGVAHFPGGRNDVTLGPRVNTWFGAGPESDPAPPWHP
jgi:hypothetical protein